MRVLVIIESPLQLINANEFLQLTKQTKDCDFCFINCKTQNNIKQLHQVFHALEIQGKIIEISKNNALKNFISRTSFFLKVRNQKNKIKNNRYDFVLVGHILSMYQTVLANGVIANKIVYVDDGNSAYIEQKELRKEKKVSFFTSKQRAIAKLSGCNIDLKYNDKLNFYTMYKNLIVENHPYLSFEYNNFNYLRKKLLHKESNNNHIFFIGSPFNGKIISRGAFKESVKKIVEHYKGKDIMYFPHRYEDKEQLNVIEEANWKVINFGLPIEIALIKMENAPLEFAFFYSTAFESLSKLLNKNFTSFQFNFAELMLQEELITGLYKEYETNKRITKVHI